MESHSKGKLFITASADVAYGWPYGAWRRLLTDEVQPDGSLGIAMCKASLWTVYSPARSECSGAAGNQFASAEIC
jgi:hypothetical protein